MHVELDDMRVHSMRHNLIFTFDPDSVQYKESSGENCVALTRTFLASVLGIDNAQEMYIPVAHQAYYSHFPNRQGTRNRYEAY